MNAITSFENHFNELKLLRKRAGDLTHSDFDQMSNLVFVAQKEDVLEEAEQLCLDFIKKNRDIVIVLYLLALLRYYQNKNGDEAIKQIVSRLQEKGGDNVVDFLLNEVMLRHRSVDLLKLVASHHKKRGNMDSAVESWKQILLIDREDPDISLSLGKYYEKKDVNQALYYYQMAFKCSLGRGVHDQPLEILRKLIVLFPSTVQRYLENLKMLSIQLSAEEKNDLYAFLLKNQEKNNNNTMCAIVMIIKSALSENIILYNQIFLLIKAYRQIYQDHELLEEFLVYSRLLAEVKNKKNFKSAKVLLSIIETFEKYIQFHRGSFVRHKSFGYGILQDLKKSADLTNKGEARFFIDFEKKSNHQMALHIAVGSLGVVSPKDLYCLKLFDVEALKKLISYNVSQVDTALLSAILETLESPVQKKDIAQLMKNFIAADQWDSCWNYIKKSIDETDKFEEIDRCISFRSEGEDLLISTLFRLEKTSDPIEQIKIIDSFIPILGKDPKNSSSIFEQILFNIQKKNKYALLFLSYLFHLTAQHHFDRSYDFSKSFNDIFGEDGLILNFKTAPYMSLRQHILGFCKNYLNPDVYVPTIKNLFFALDFKEKEIVLDHLDNVAERNLIDGLFKQVNENFFEEPTGFVAFSHYLFFKKKEGFSVGELLEKNVRLLDSLHRGVEDQKNRGFSKKIFTAVEKIIFDKDRIFLFLQTCSDSVLVKKIFSSLEKLTFLENDIKVKIRTLHERVGRESN